MWVSLSATFGTAEYFPPGEKFFSWSAGARVALKRAAANSSRGCLEVLIGKISSGTRNVSFSRLNLVAIVVAALMIAPPDYMSFPRMLEYPLSIEASSSLRSR